MEFDLLKDLAELTTIPETALQKLSEKANWCICNDIHEALLSNESTFSVDVGIGTIIINITNNNINYRFEPTKKLENSIRETVIDKKNPLSNTVEAMLAYRITNIYKDYL